MAGSDASRARARFEIERDHDVRSRRDHRRTDRTFATNSRSAGPERRIHRVHLLDVSAATHGLKSETADRRGGIFADAGAGADFFGQYRQHPEFLGHAGPRHWAGGVEVW